jgi:hypothetical protein
VADGSVKPARRPWHLWVVGVASLLWNSVGALDFVMTETRNKAYMSSFTPAQLEFYYGFPIWFVVAWGIAVWGGLLGSLSLLLRLRLALQLFLASVICIVLSDIHTFALSNGLRVMGGSGAAFSAVIFVIGVLQFVYARAMCGRRALG